MKKAAIYEAHVTCQAADTVNPHQTAVRQALSHFTDEETQDRERELALLEQLVPGAREQGLTDGRTRTRN